MAFNTTAAMIAQSARGMIDRTTHTARGIWNPPPGGLAPAGDGGGAGSVDSGSEDGHGAGFVGLGPGGGVVEAPNAAPLRSSAPQTEQKTSPGTTTPAGPRGHRSRPVLDGAPAGAAGVAPVWGVVAGG
jgi:hypothetical protein